MMSCCQWLRMAGHVCNYLMYDSVDIEAGIIEPEHSKVKQAMCVRSQ